ncbi:MAG: NAD(P)-dependent alcohol dehydrogenase [Pseudomonadota bacterium]
MRAYRFDTLGTLDELKMHHETMPRPQRGEVLVKIRAVALNYRDLSIALGNYIHAARPGLIPCSDAAGEIAAVGEGVTSYVPGDRVLGTFHPRWFGGRPPFATSQSESYGSAADGWLSEYKCVSQEALIRLPAALSFEEGATLPCAAVTAWNALSGSTPIRSGHTVLTLGTGGVSIFALQIAKAVGAKVIATTSSDQKGERLKALGADHVINYSTIPDWGSHVRRLTGGLGVDCVVEVGGPATINESLRAVRWGGDVVLIGFLTTDKPEIDYFHLKRSGAVVRSISVGDRTALEELVRMAAASCLKPVIDRIFAFEEAKAAFMHLQERRHVGKIVVRVQD